MHPPDICHISVLHGFQRHKWAPLCRYSSQARIERSPSLFFRLHLICLWEACLPACSVCKSKCQRLCCEMLDRISHVRCSKEFAHFFLILLNLSSNYISVLAHWSRIQSAQEAIKLHKSKAAASTGLANYLPAWLEWRRAAQSVMNTTHERLRRQLVLEPLKTQGYQELLLLPMTPIWITCGGIRDQVNLTVSPAVDHVWVDGHCVGLSLRNWVEHASKFLWVVGAVISRKTNA